MRRYQENKAVLKRRLLIERTAHVLGVSHAESERLLGSARHQSFRINTLKVRHPEVVLKQLTALGWAGKPYKWYPHGYRIGGDKRLVSDSQLAAEGAVYVQNAASWLPVLALDPQPGEKILDMCAAPGGKAAHILELTHNKAEVWVNDNSRPRMAKMRANFVRLGAEPARQTLFDITQLARKLEGEQFDKILLDAPCSGEGMLDINVPKDFTTWSVAHIRRLQSLQKRALLQGWQLLKPGGTLVYSTCTIAPEENELLIDYGLRKLPGAALQSLDYKLPNRVEPIQMWQRRPLVTNVADCLRLAPSSNIEAFFVAKLLKLDKDPE